MAGLEWVTSLGVRRSRDAGHDGGGAAMVVVVPPLQQSVLQW